MFAVSKIIFFFKSHMNTRILFVSFCLEQVLTPASFVLRGFFETISDGYDVAALHYLMKPVSYEKISEGCPVPLKISVKLRLRFLLTQTVKMLSCCFPAFTVSRLSGIR